MGEVANHPESKLSHEERENLERDLNITEFDTAIEKAKLNTSPGIDSISNRFIKTFWHIFRVPLLDYAKCCYDKGLLTENFRCAKIRLIPKKGDTSLLKNWRPISLLNCFYKIISRVIALRLRSVMDKITRVGQKGFSGSKYCQEVLIGIVDTINHINFRNKKGMLISLDIKKAFDSTSHSYLQSVYSFFNFGPNFIKWLNLIGTNRKACIILGNGVYSEFFDLERGNAQGDTTSPYIFNLGFQILILKLTFDLQIEGIVDFPTVANNILPLPRTVSTYNRKVSAYADDASLIVKFSYENLTRIKEILEQFGLLSSLVCNVEKTALLPIGRDIVIDERILNLGFTITDKVTILGLDIDRNGYNVSNFTKMVQKVNMQLNIWRPFNLSLPGRISIAKTMLYSQINYLGCFLLVPADVIKTLDELIMNFVQGKLSIAKKRMYLPPKNGGLGLFPVSDFLDAQKCTWIKRANNYSEPWKVIIYNSNYGCIFNSKGVNINHVEYPIVHAICNSFERLSGSFTVTQDNFLNSYLFENEKFTMDLHSKKSLSRDIFSAPLFEQYAAKLYSLRYCNLFNDDGSFKTLEQRREMIGAGITPLHVFHLRNVCSTARLRFKKKDPDEQKSVHIGTFLFRKKRGSSHLRKMLLINENLGVTHNINKFATNLDIIVSGEQSKILNSWWTNNYSISLIRTKHFL